MDLADRIAAQDGLITLAQALEAGLSARTVRRRARSVRGSGSPRVFRAADHPPTERARVRAAALSAGEQATVVGLAVAWWWRFRPEAPEVVTVTVPRASRPTARPGVRVRRQDGAGAVLLDGVRVSRRADAILEAVGELDVADGVRLVDRALLGGRVALTDLVAAQHARTGRWGATRSGRVLALVADGSRSEAERLTRRVLDGAGVAGWRAGHRVHVAGWGWAVLDLAFVVERVAVEVDGWAYHRDVDAFVGDRVRQNALVAAGWTVLRTTWYELAHRPEVFVAALRRALGR